MVLSWFPDATEMTDLDNDSIYEFNTSLLANSTYEYKYINGNTWGESENVSGFCGGGNGNRVLSTFEEESAEKDQEVRKQAMQT